MRTWLVAANDLVRRVRNRSAIIMAFVAPLALAVVFGLLVGGTDEFEISIGVVDLDGSDRSVAIIDGLSEPDDDSPLVVETIDTVDAIRERVDDGDLDVGLVLPEGLGDAGAGGRVELTVFEAWDRPISGEVGRAVAQSIKARFDQVGLTLATASELSETTVAEELLATAGSIEPPLTIAEQPPGGGDIDGTAFFGGSMSIVFLFFTVGFAARSILDERKDGTVERMLATPTSAASIVGGKVLSVSLIALGGFVMTWLITTVAFGANWGPSPTVLAVIVATVVSIGGVAFFIASLARTPQQADAATSAVAFALALLGGNFLGPGAGIDVLAKIRLLTPNGWSLVALTEAAADRASIADVAPALLVLLVIGAVFGGLGLFRVHRVISP